MVRPIKHRKIYNKPIIDLFKPAGIPLGQLQQICLTEDEFEAVRLADFEGLYQDQAAEQMNISRQTFGNILALAHRKIADSLVNAKALQIAGGTVTLVERMFHCTSCQHNWQVSCGTQSPSVCPACGNTVIGPVCPGGGKDITKRCKKFCRRPNYENLHPSQGQ